MNNVPTVKTLALEKPASRPASGARWKVRQIVNTPTNTAAGGMRVTNRTMNVAASRSSITQALSGMHLPQFVGIVREILWFPSVPIVGTRLVVRPTRISSGLLVKLERSAAAIATQSLLYAIGCAGPLASGGLPKNQPSHRSTCNPGKYVQQLMRGLAMLADDGLLAACERDVGGVKLPA